MLQIYDEITNPQTGLKRKKKSIFSSKKHFKGILPTEAQLHRQPFSTGQKLVKWFKENKNLSIHEAVEQGNRLLESNYIMAPDGTSQFGNNDIKYILTVCIFRLVEEV